MLDCQMEPHYYILYKSTPIKILLLIMSMHVLTSSQEPSNSLNQQLQTANQNCTFFNMTNNISAIQIGNCNNLNYYVNFALGSDNQELSYLIYTGIISILQQIGQSYTWIPLVSGNQTGGFHFQLSSTFNLTNTSGVLVYPENSFVMGDYGSDYLQFSYTTIDVEIDVLFITNKSGPGIPPFIDGCLSLMYSQHPPNFLDLAFQQGQIISSAFAIDLSLDTEPSYFYYNNGLNQSYVQPTQWTEQTQTSASWSTLIIGMSVAGNQIKQFLPTSAILNTAVSFINFDQNLFNQIVTEYFNFTFCFISSAGFPVCPCNLNSSWPTFSFMLYGAQVYLDPSAYKFKFSYTGLCKALIWPNADTGTVILGVPFFWNYVVTFDKLNSRIGFNGKVKPIYITKGSSSFFLLSQYILSALMFALGLSGVVIHIVRYVNQRHKLMQQSDQQYPKIITQPQQPKKKVRKSIVQLQTFE